MIFNGFRLAAAGKYARQILTYRETQRNFTTRICRLKEQIKADFASHRRLRMGDQRIDALCSKTCWGKNPSLLLLPKAHSLSLSLFLSSLFSFLCSLDSSSLRVRMPVAHDQSRSKVLNFISGCDQNRCCLDTLRAP